jgi:hypothetical protein
MSKAWILFLLSMMLSALIWEAHQRIVLAAYTEWMERLSDDE